MINSQFLKLRYADIRTGMTVVFPLLSLVNFIIIAHSLTSLNDLIGIELFAVITTISLLVLLSVIGFAFRKHQHSTDLTLLYENNKNQLRVNLLILQALASQNTNAGSYKLSQQIQNEIDYLQSLLKN